jgi:putative SOS response-associated peptidase YedK
MCNRYSQTKREVRIVSRFGQIQAEFAPRYNIAPTQSAPVAVLKDGALALQDMCWGFEGFDGQPLMNARTETAYEKRTFHDAWRERHCIVPCDGFYEWKDTPEGKQPYRFVQRGRALFWFAALWDQDRFTILTMPALGCVATMHDRMPVMFREETIDWWIEPGAIRTPEQLIECCAATESLECYPVTRRMSNSRYAAPDCIEPIVLPQQELSL